MQYYLPRTHLQGALTLRLEAIATVFQDVCGEQRWGFLCSSYNVLQVKKKRESARLLGILKSHSDKLGQGAALEMYVLYRQIYFPL